MKERGRLKQDDGAIMVLSALVLVPLLLMAGLVIDGLMIANTNQRLQNAADAGANAGAMNFSLTTNATSAQTFASQIFSVNTTGVTGAGTPSIVVDAAAKTVAVSVSATVPTYLMKLGGVANTTTSAASTSQVQSSPNGAEVSIVIDSSQNSTYWYGNILSTFTGCLQTFIDNLSADALVSIVPITTEIKLDSTKMNWSNFYTLLSPTNNEESPDSVYVPINTTNNSPWASAPSNAIDYFINHDSFPTKKTANKVGSTSWTSYRWSWRNCGGWGGTCSGSNCYPYYSYTMQDIQSILPLTKNKTLIKNYLTTLGGCGSTWTNYSDGLWSSLITWGWRTIAPTWSNILASNSDADTTVYSYGTYPKSYGSSNPKYVILMVHDQNYIDSIYFLWDAPSISYGYTIYYSKNACKSGNNAWLMTMYGMVPAVSDLSGFYDVSCENYYYWPIDKFFSLGLTTSPAYVQASYTARNYVKLIGQKIDSKFLTICKNMRSEGIKIYVICWQSQQQNHGTDFTSDNNNQRFFTQCTGSSNQVFVGCNTTASINTALSAIRTDINTAAAVSGGGGIFPNVKAALIN